MGRMACAAWLLLVPGVTTAQASRPAATRMGTGATALEAAVIAEPGGVSRTATGALDRVVVRGRSGDVTPDVEEVQFRGVAGREGRVVRLDGVRVLSVIPSKSERYVAVIEKGPGHGSDRLGPWYILRYYDVHGRELWHAQICCARTDDIWNQVVMAEDGSVVAVVDANAGSPCDMGEDGFAAPSGCVGLRVYTGGGEEVLRIRNGQWPLVSPRGRCVSYWDGAAYQLLNTQSRKHIKLPANSASDPRRVDDDGTVDYFNDDWDPPGRPRPRFVPGKGLERLPDRIAGHPSGSATETGAGR